MFWKKKKPAAPATTMSAEQMEIAKILKKVLEDAPRVEGAPVSTGYIKNGQKPAALLKTLYPTMKEDLGENGKVSLFYDAEEEELTLMLTFSYGKDSDDMALVNECLDAFDLEEDADFPGYVGRIEISYIKDREITEVNLISEGVVRNKLESAAACLVDDVFYWMDMLYESFQEAYGEGDFGDDDE